MRSSRVITGPEKFQEAEAAEIAAQISIPQDGGWGWVVVVCAFWSIFILDGVVFTYGSLYRDIIRDLAAPESAVALVNSVAVAISFIFSPLGSAFCNRFGFRASTMIGTVICSSALLGSYYATTVTMLCMLYGVIGGFGFSFVNIASYLVVGFYFEKLRSLALSIATIGSSFGIMVFSPVNTYILELAGWRLVMLFHSGLFGTIYFASMAYKPLLSLTVMNTTDIASRTVTYLPSLAAVRRESLHPGVEGVTATKTERVMGAVSNIHFPTAANVVEEVGATPASQPGPSAATSSRLTLIGPQRRLSHREHKQIKAIISKTVFKENVDVVVPPPPAKKRSCWARLCHWEEHVEESRPMYRDDAFYGGPVDKLPTYRKSIIGTTPEGRTGLEYQLAVSRAATTADLKEKRGIFTTAARRVLATMLDPVLLSRVSFRLLCMSGFLLYVGLLVPFVFIQDRNIAEGIDPTISALYVSVIGFSTIIGKMTTGAMAMKLNPLKVYYWCCIVAGTSTMLSNVYFNAYYQAAYCATFGFCIGNLPCLRSLIIVNLYGLEKLTNGTGLMLMCQGVGTLVSTPSASMIKSNFGYSIAFNVAGVSLICAGLVLCSVSGKVKRENELANKNVLQK